MLPQQAFVVGRGLPHRFSVRGLRQPSRRGSGPACITALAEEALRAISGDRGTHVKAPRQGLASSKSCGRTSRTSTMRQPCCAVSRGRSTWNAWWTSAPRSKAQEVRMQLGCVGIKKDRAREEEAGRSEGGAKGVVPRGGPGCRLASRIGARP